MILLLVVDDMYLHWKTFVQSKIYICALQFYFKGHPSLLILGESLPKIVKISKPDKEVFDRAQA